MVVARVLPTRLLVVASVALLGAAAATAPATAAEPAAPGRAAHPMAAAKVTSLTNAGVKYTMPKEHYVVLKRGPVTAVVVDNAAVDVPECPGHRAGYNGVAALRHEQRGENLFVPAYAGLNLEHIHGGEPLAELFEPRKSPMELRVVDGNTVELHQPATPHTKLESCGRYQLLEDGTIEYTFECVARHEPGKAAPDPFPHGYLGLFWACYIDKPESTAVHFRGRRAADDKADAPAAAWIESTSPKHGVKAAHPPAGPLPELKHSDTFPVTLAFNRSDFVHADAWYYGVSHGMAMALIFRPRDRVWFAQSPSGGGNGNPAWDFQWIVPDYKPGQAYGFTMRTAYVPFENGEQVERAIQKHREALAAAGGARDGGR